MKVVPTDIIELLKIIIDIFYEGSFYFYKFFMHFMTPHCFRFYRFKSAGTNMKSNKILLNIF